MAEDRAEPEVPADAVGRRVSCGGERATVRYVGPVPPTSGVWLGVEWDDPGRGKHDGSHEGVQFFRCRHPTGGSFVRPAKASFGLDLVSAARQAYPPEDATALAEGSSEWGVIRARSLEILPSLLLAHSQVNGPGADGDIRRTTPNVRWLDLNGTLLRSWEEVAAISRQLEQLERLVLSSNRLCLPSDPSAQCNAFSCLKVLVLNNCDLNWLQVLTCAPMWPQLEDLSLEDNNITELQRPEVVLQSLRSLNLSGNGLVQDSIPSVGALPRLQQLNLSNTGLSAIRFDDVATGGQTAMFPALTNLNLDDDNVTEWWAVDELSKLSNLIQLSCRRNALMSSDGNRKTADQLVIAKLGRLEVLNGCQISPEERRGAELDYIKRFGEEWLKAGGRRQASSDFTCQHPRYLSLIDKYGAPEDSELKKQTPFAIRNHLLKVTFVFPDDANRAPIEKKLPASMLVQKVKTLLNRLLKVPAAELRLSYTSDKASGTEFDISSDLKTLQFYSVEDGDQVLVRWSAVELTP